MVPGGTFCVGTVLLLAAGSVFGFDCEFPNRECGWNWSEAWTLLSAANISALGPTAPQADSENNVKGQWLFGIFFGGVPLHPSPPFLIGHIPFPRW
ncbi:hypothetical protein AVEN_83098-1 [Araneus ventricosus]|uniref:MAM domain-containing protein n=1 Tax=Araneus ventricosus TaxID=182803 RepID=A0A4Y2AM89_ARAVE|nr:hypothetical protein AVEN_83098-1 [Araneus ventricosus]